jgi:DNA-binding NarL/FixJ family response regulator
VIRVFASSAELESVVRSIANLQLARSEDQADVVLTDNEAAEQNGLPTVLLLDTADSAQVSSALRSGIRGVLSREATPEEIEGAIQAVNAGLVVLTPESLPPPSEALTEPLSDREREVLELIAEGLSNKLIAHRLSISEHTVKTHVAAILAKFGAGSRTEAVSQAIRRGLVML